MKNIPIKIVDTNYIIRLLMNDNQSFYDKAFALFEAVRLGNENIIIPESVLTECVYVLSKSYNVERDKISHILINLLNYRGVINKDKIELLEGLKLYGIKKLDIVDCLLTAKSKINGYTLMTFDKGIKL